MNLTGFGGALVMSLTAVNVQHSNVGDKLKVLGRQLLRQEDAGCHHHNGLGGIGLKLTQSISNTHKSLARTSGHNHLPLDILKQSIQSTLLVRSELDHRSHRVWDYYSRKRGPVGPPAPLKELFHPDGFPKRIIICKCIMAHIMGMVNGYSHPFTQFFMIIFHQLNSINHVINYMSSLMIL